jgi:hypothetical protein
VLTTRHPLSEKVGTNFADKQRSLGQYSSFRGLKVREFVCLFVCFRGGKVLGGDRAQLLLIK